MTMPLSPDLTDALATFVAGRSPGHPVLVASDFDGVLAPLVDDPSASAPTAAATAALESLASVPVADLRLALVSGRDLETLPALSRAPLGTSLVGSHGAEQGVVVAGAEGGTTVESRPFALTDGERSRLHAVRAGLEAIARGAEGAWVEDKPSAAVLHTRQADPEQAARAGDAARALGVQHEVHTMTGKDVVEIAVVDTSKGVALVRLRDELDAAAVLYLGDDVTDERAFEALSPSDVTVKVGPGQTAARFRVASVDEAASVLAEVARLLS
jgi:trehalose 6-phosphate phosphatase